MPNPTPQADRPDAPVAMSDGIFAKVEALYARAFKGPYTVGTNTDDEPEGKCYLIGSSDGVIFARLARDVDPRVEAAALLMAFAPDLVAEVARLRERLEAASEALHAIAMHAKCDMERCNALREEASNYEETYTAGHRDARHAIAEAIVGYFAADHPVTTLNGRTTQDAIRETERLLRETMERWDENATAGWMLTRVTKAAEALADRPGSTP